MRVIRSWKGSFGGRVEIYTSYGGGDCGYPFVVGNEYLVYAYRAPSGRLVTSICGRTRPIAEAREDLSALGPGVRPRRWWKVQ